MHALRAAFWATAHTVSACLRHVEASGSNPSGEEVHQVCRSRALGLFGSFVSPQREAEEAEGKTDRFTILDKVFCDMREDMSFLKEPAALPPASLPSYPLDRLSELHNSREAKRVASLSMGMETDFVEKKVRIRSVKRLKPTKRRKFFQPLVPDDQDTSIRENITDEFTLIEVKEEQEVEEVQEPGKVEVEYVIEDADRFNNNNRFSETSGWNDEIQRMNRMGASIMRERREKAAKKEEEGKEGEEATKSALNDYKDNSDLTAGCRNVLGGSGVRLTSTSVATETQLRAAVKTLLSRLAMDLYSDSNREELFRQLAFFLQGSRLSSSFDRGTAGDISYFIP